MNNQLHDKDLDGLSPDEAAARWMARRTVADDLSPDETAAFEAWLAASPENRAAYARAEERWSIFEDCRDDRNIKALRQAALAAAPARPRWAAYGIAASVAAALVTASVLFVSMRAGPGVETVAVADLTAFGTPDYVTEKGERLHANLPDGTIITLNTGSAVDVAFVDNERRVKLLAGEAYFEVAKNPDRPFVVMAGGRRITALGTAFNVRLDGDFEVTLVEGKVAVDEEAATQVASTATNDGGVFASAPSRKVLEPGQKLVAAAEGVRLVNDEKIAKELRWRDGFIEFEAESLSSAVAEFNRYALTPIVIDDNRVADLKISGVFRTARPEGFVEVAEEILPVTAVNAGGKVKLVWTDG